MSTWDGWQWVQTKGTCVRHGCEVRVRDGVAWCDEHGAEFRDRLRQASSSDPKRRREAVEYIEQWLARMKARARGG